ncbi:Na+/H+ antiporter subunit A [Salirhabdus salicampi]|uniref:Na+/H+ antiporter subunit A n=1 Tax=Salirhabdus salicampi TaxID=476102 RepID=UPI0020C3C296|nr:Na+/H+ antiporter subunit A [Salirhabdus salicampi]MCP8616938.1 Na+/H+ antiporter subunit A [Salirhabdus salicampi]
MIFTVFVPLLVTLMIPFVNRWKERIHTGWFLLPIPLAIFIYFIQFVGKDFQPFYQSYSWVPSLQMNLDFYLDGFSLLFALLISGIGTLVLLYSIYYLHKSENLGHFYIYLFLFMAAMLGVVLSDNVFALYGFWELTSFSSFLLIGYWHHRERSRYGAQKSMLITVFGGLSLLGGFVTLATITGTTSIQQMIEQKDLIIGHAYFPLILIFVFLGAFTKSAQFPFHIWLPDAMEAPTPVSAYLHSATMVKAGIFLIGKFAPILSGVPSFFIVVSLIGIITLCWGSFMAVRQVDLKGILAYSTISQLGMIMAMFGFGTKVAIFAAVFHILNHATFKGSLFMIAGIVDHETGTRDIRKLGGLMTLMPISTTLAVFGAFSMAGVPLPFLNGFYSKEMFFEATLDFEGATGQLMQLLQTAIPWLAVFGSIFTFVYSMYFFFGTFRGKYKEDELEQKPHEAPWGMLISPIILVVGVITIGLFPKLVNMPLLTHAASTVANTTIEKNIYFWHGFELPLFMSIAVIVFGTVLYLTMKKWVPVYDVFPGRWNFNRVYDFIVDKLEEWSKAVTEFYMTGSVKHYVRNILIAILVVGFSVFWFTEGMTIKTDNLAEVTLPEILVAVTMALAALATIFTKSRIAAILILGVVGYGLSLLFVMYRAPDLALTQLIVETVTVALFLLCFYHLPELKKLDRDPVSRGLNGIVAIAFGAFMALIGISAHSSSWFEPISGYFLENAHDLGGGDNVVNVILVDFRGIDTLMEIAVLGVAALAIYSMIRLRRDKEAK